MVIASFVTGVLAVAISKGRSVKGWTSLAISGTLIGAYGWMMISGK
jgi:hypothetical protein